MGKEKQKEEVELKAELQRNGRLRYDKDGTQVVNVDNANREYLPGEYRKKGVKTIPYSEFLKSYMEIRGRVKTDPEKFLKKVFGKRNFEEAFAGLAGEVSLPYYPEQKKFGSPSYGVAVTGRLENQGADEIKGSIGYEKAESAEDSGPFLGVEKGGVFAKSIFSDTLSEIKKFAVGIRDGILSFTRTIGKKSENLLSIGAGPWIGSLNIPAGSFGGAFSWIAGAFGMLQKMIRRALEETKKLEGTGTLKDIRDNSTINGMLLKDGRHKVYGAISVGTIDRKKSSKDEVVFNYGNSEYIARMEEGKLCVYKHESVPQKVWKVLNPVTLVQDAVNVAIVEPVFKLVDFADAFIRPPKTKKLSKDEVDKYEEKLDTAIERGNLNTARYFARMLVDGTRGREKGSHMLELDAIEWKLSHSGFFLGYIKDMGFGRKARMGEEAIGKRIEENIGILKKGPAHPDYAAAQYYINEKAKFKINKMGTKLPMTALPEKYVDKVLDAAARYKEAPVAQQKEVKVEFEKLKISAGSKQAEFSRFLKFLQQVYENVPEYKDRVRSEYNLMNESREYASALFTGVATKLERNNVALPADPAKLPKEELRKIYKIGFES